ncbi:MAG: LysM peptidoglycan-binding domain-containing protein [Deltaproteobacteria bacterium]
MPQYPQAIMYTIQPGDTLWMLAQRYNTTVYTILATNPGITPNNLHVGQTIWIFPGHKYYPPSKGYAAPVGISYSELELRNYLRMLWEEHIAWTRMAIISTAANLPDQDLVVNRLLQNAPDMGAALKPFYGNEKGEKFSSLIKDHLVIASQLVNASKVGDSKAAAAAEKKWYDNADEIARFLSSINPYWSEEALTEMLYNHLALTKTEAVARLKKDYAADIAAYDKIEKQALKMADTLSEGIVKQFPQKFKK